MTASTPAPRAGRSRSAVPLDRLLASPTRRERVTHVEHVPARAGRNAPWPEWAPELLVQRLRHFGVKRLWGHQARTAELAWSGRSVIVATGTASGKSVGYFLPAISGIFEGSTVLYLSPTKALAADQLSAIRALRLTQVKAATYDGDTPPEDRERVRKYANYVLTNPDMLHRSVLPRHSRWAPFLRRLRYVIVDECHGYRGVFGSHVAQVLRRLRRICARYGPEPTFILASATVTDAATFANRLVGVPFEEVTDDASPRGATALALWEPPLTDLTGERGAPVRRTATAEAADLLSDLVVSGVQTLVFVRSRRAAEAVSLSAKRVLQEAIPGESGATTPVDSRGSPPRSPGTPRASPTNRDRSPDTSPHSPTDSDPSPTNRDRSPETSPHPPTHSDPSPADRVAAYRAGYLPEERRELERRLRSGDLLGLAATTALELGIDVSGLDAVILAGWPGTRTSMWQQVGRAGRGGGDSFAVLVARDDPLDTYLVHHPDALFGRPVEAAVLDPDNPYVLGPHLCAAAAESPLGDGDLTLFGPSAEGVVADLVRRGWLRHRATGWFWTRPERATDLVDIRGTGGPPIHVVEAGTGRLLGTVDEVAAHTTVHQGAVYLHQGESYVVRDLDLDDHVALVDPADPDYATTAREATDIRVLETLRSTPWDEASVHFGTVEVTSQVVAYQRRRIQTGEILGEEPLDLPTRTLRTRAVWWTLSDSQVERLGERSADLAGAAHAAEHASIGLLPLFATCDRWDIGGVSTARHVDLGRLAVFVYDGHDGGAGFAERGYAAARRWLTATRQAIESCECEAGCPSCIQSPKCGNGNEPLHKIGAIRMLEELLP